MNDPKYQDIRSGEVALLTSADAGALVRVIAGTVDGHAGPGSTYTPMTLVHATIEPGARLDLPWDVDFNALVYVLNGQGTVGTDGRPIRMGQSAVFGAGDYLTITADGSQESRSPKLDVIVVGGRPIREPLAWAGPFVMNTKAEVLQAYEDFQRGHFGHIPPESARTSTGAESGSPNMARIYRDALRRPARARDLGRRPRARARARSPRGTGPGSWSSCAAARPAPPPRSSDPRGSRGTGSPDAPASPTPRAGRTPAWRPRRAPSWRRTSTGVNDGLHADAPELDALGLEPAALGGVDAAGGLPRPAPAVRQPARQALVRPRPRGARRRRRPALARGPAARAAATPGRSAEPGRRAASRSIGGDPHRTIESPGVYQQVRLACDEFDVVGLRVPGRPRRPALRARGRRGVGDHQRDGRLPGRVRRAAAARGRPGRGARPGRMAAGVRGSSRSRCSATSRAGRDRGDGPRAAVLGSSVDRGPRAQPARARRRCWATSGFDALLPLLRARTVDDVDAALDAWVEPVNNVVIADRPRRGALTASPAGCRCRDERNRRGIVVAADPDGGLDRLARPAAARRHRRRRAGGHRQRAPRPGERPRSARRSRRRTAPRRLHDLLDGRDDLTAGRLRGLPRRHPAARRSTRSSHCSIGPSPGLPGRPVRERDPPLGRADGRRLRRAPRRSPPGARRFASRLGRGAGVRAAAATRSPTTRCCAPWLDLDRPDRARRSRRWSRPGSRSGST